MNNHKFSKLITFVLSIIMACSSFFFNTYILEAQTKNASIRITYPIDNTSVTLGTKISIRFENFDKSDLIFIEISKHSNPINDDDWINLNYFDQATKVQSGEYHLEIKKEYQNQPLRKIRIKTRAGLIGKESISNSVTINITNKSTLLEPTWIDSEAIGNRKALIFIHGIGLRINIPPQNLLPEENSWDQLLIFLKNYGIFVTHKPYLFMYDSNDTDDTFTYKMTNRNNFGIPFVAAELASLIQNKPELFNKRISIVAHSMGGLVARQFMVNTSLNGRTSGDSIDNVITLFTPHRGSPIPNFPPTQLETYIGSTSGNGKSKFLEDISWDDDYINIDKWLIYDELIKIDKNNQYLYNEGNPFLKLLNSSDKSDYNWKVKPYAGYNFLLSTGYGSLVDDSAFVLVVYKHWVDGIYKATRNNANIFLDSLFYSNDGVVTMDSAIGQFLNFQSNRTFNLDHMSWTSGNREMLYNSIAEDLKQTFSPHSCDFKLNASSSFVEEKKGVVATITINTNYINNNTSQVKFVLTSSPALPAGSYTNPPINPINIGQSASLSINTTNCKLGTYKLTIYGTGCSVSKNSIITLVVKDGGGSKPPPSTCDFKLSASPASVEVKKGDVAKYTITANPKGNQVSQVKFILTSSPALPAGSYTNPPINPINIGQSASLSINTTNCKLGTYKLVLVGSGCNKRDPVNMTLIVKDSGSQPPPCKETPTKPGKPRLMSVIVAKECDLKTFKIEWPPSTIPSNCCEITNYEVSYTINGSSEILVNNDRLNILLINNPINGAIYRLKVRSHNCNGPSLWSDEVEFSHKCERIICEPQITSFSPEITKCSTRENVALTLNTPVKKVLCNIIKPNGILHDKYDFINTGNAWENRVDFTNEEGMWLLRFEITCLNDSLTSITKSINITCPKPVLSIPVPFSPSDKSVVYTTTPTLIWNCNPPANLKGYEVALFPTSECNDNLSIEKVTITKMFWVPSILQLGKKYYWRVRCVTNDTQHSYGEWSPIFSFEVKQKPPNILITKGTVLYYQSPYSGELALYDFAYYGGFSSLGFLASEDCVVDVEIYKDEVNLGVPYWKSENVLIRSSRDIYGNTISLSLLPGKYWWRYKAVSIISNGKIQDWTWANGQKPITQNAHFELLDYVPEPTNILINVNNQNGSKFSINFEPQNKNSIRLIYFKTIWSVDKGSIERIKGDEGISENQFIYYPSGNDYYANLSCKVYYRGLEYGPFTYKLKVGNPTTTNRPNTVKIFKNTNSTLQSVFMRNQYLSTCMCD